jgi:spermidine synthase
MYEAGGVRTDVVDIDSDVEAIARDWFGFRPGGRVVIADARRFLLECRDRYDYLVLDVFGGDATPGHLMSREAFQLMRSRLTPGGVLAINLLGGLDDPLGAAPSVARTLRHLFEHVDVYPLFDPRGSDRSGNIAVLAYDGPRALLPDDLFASRTLHPFVRQRLTPVPRWRHEFPEGSGLLLTDDYNPSDCSDLGLKEKFRRVILANTDWDVLVH